MQFDILCRLLLLLLAGAALFHSAAPDIASDRAALLALRSAVGGRVLFWNLSNPTPCNWPGVACSPDNASVVELHFPGMGLSGRLPPNTISNLTNLQTLSLRYNSLTGDLPGDIFASLKSLRNVYLQHNSFSGEIPDSVFSLTSLVRVNLAENNFSGPIPAGFNNLTRLGTLYLQSNRFTGPVPDLNLPSLVQFDVSNNLLTGEIPRRLSSKPRNAFQGNSLCGEPLDPCGGRKSSKSLSGGAIAGIVVGAVLGFLLILLILFCLCRKRAKSKDKGLPMEREIEIPSGKAAVADVSAGSYAAPAAAAAVTREKAKGSEVNSGIGEGKKGLVFVGNVGWNFRLDDLLKASAEVLGKGTMGTAYKAVLESGLAVAVKRLRDINLGEREFGEKMDEIGRMDHENLVPLRAYHFNREEKLLVFDYLPMGSLSALLHGNKGAGRTPLNWETRLTIALGTARGISYLHSQGPSVSHGSIKSSNVLLTRSYDARISDFGLAQLASPSATPTRVAGYRAPEVTDPRRISHKADVYSFGVLLLELLTGKASLMNEEGVDLPRWVQSVVREEWTAEVFDLELLRYQNVEEDMVQLLQLAVDCTAQYPDNRPAMAEIVPRIESLCRSTDHNDDIVDEPSDD